MHLVRCLLAPAGVARVGLYVVPDEAVKASPPSVDGQVDPFRLVISAQGQAILVPVVSSSVCESRHKRGAESVPWGL